MNQGVLAELFDQHGARLYRYALMLMSDAVSAEDAVQEAFCQLARAGKRDPTLLTVAYLTTIVRHECFSALRRRRRQPATGPFFEPQAAGPSEEQRLLVESGLRTLGPEQREVIYLKVFEGLTFQEIAARCSISPNTAASRYRYALAALRVSLDIDGSKT